VTFSSVVVVVAECARPTPGEDTDALREGGAHGGECSSAMTMENVEKQTVEDFGDEWSRFDQSALSDERAAGGVRPRLRRLSLAEGPAERRRVRRRVRPPPLGCLELVAKLAALASTSADLGHVISDDGWGNRDSQPKTRR